MTKAKIERQTYGYIMNGPLGSATNLNTFTQLFYEGYSFFMIISFKILIFYCSKEWSWSLGYLQMNKFLRLNPC